MSTLTLLERVIVPTLVICLLVGGVASVLFGLALVLRTPQTLVFMRRMNSWVSTRRALKTVEIPRSVGEPSKRGKIGLALFFLVGGAFALYVLLVRLEVPRVALILGVNLKRWFIASVAVQTMKWFLVAGSVLALLVGVLMLFFPGRLTAFEQRMNRWYSTRKLLPPGGEVMKSPLDMLVDLYPRTVGWIIVAASVLVAAAMAVLLATKIAG